MIINAACITFSFYTLRVARRGPSSSSASDAGGDNADDMNTLLLPLLALSSFVGSQGFVASSHATCTALLAKQHATAKATASRLNSDSPSRRASKHKHEHSTQTTDGAPRLAFNESRIDATALAKSIPSGGKTTAVGPRQIKRPRWYNKAEATIIVLLVQRLRLLDVRGVEHMLEATEDFRKEEPRDVLHRALFLMRVAPGANFRTVIQRHPRTLLVPVQKMKRVCKLINDNYPGVNMARIVERVPSIFSRNTTRLERNINGLKQYVPEVDSTIFQAAPSMMFLPPLTVKQKVEALRWHLPGMNLHLFLKGMPTALARSKETVPRGLVELRKRFPKSSNKELVRLVESAPALMRMSGANGTLDIKVDALMTLLPGVNMTNIFANAPGVLIRNSNSLPVKVEKLEELFPSANVTKMISRTPGILYLDIDRTVKPKALWIKQAVGLEQEGLDRLIEQGPWLLKAGWGPLARLEFAVESGITRRDRPAGFVGLVRRSRAAFAAAHHPAYADFLRRRLEDEEVEEASWQGEEVPPNSWGSASACSPKPKPPEPAEDTSSRLAGTTTKLKNAAVTEGVILDSSDEDSGEAGAEGDVADETAVEVGRLEDRLGRVRKSRMGGVKDRPPSIGQSRLIAPLRSGPQGGDALLDPAAGKIVRRAPRLGP